MKIAHIITRLDLGGAQQNTLYCCAHHDPRKYEVLLLCGAGGYLDAEALKPSNRFKTYFLPELKHPIRPWWDLAAVWKISRLLKAEGVRLVHTHSSKAGILGRWAARLAGVPHVVHTVHGWGFYPRQFFPVRRAYQTLERWTAPLTDILVTVSEDNKREGLEAGIGRPRQYQVIHSGIEPRWYASSAAAGLKARKKWGLGKRPCVVVMSNFKKQKSPLDVVKVAAFLKVRHPEVHFLWAGDGPLMPKVQREIEKGGLQDNFNLFGWREDVAELLAASEALLLTSLFEGLPRVALQAMAAGKPVVATAVSGTPEAVRHGATGFLHSPGDCEGMAESLAWILEHPAQAKRMGRAGRAALKGTFLIGNMLKAIEKLYDELLQGKQ